MHVRKCQECVARHKRQECSVQQKANQKLRFHDSQKNNDFGIIFRKDCKFASESL